MQRALALVRAVQGSSCGSGCPGAPQCPGLDSGAMGFGPELWCPQGHSALLRLQDGELRLLELMRKWMSQRAKSDREYAGMLHHMFSQLEKQESTWQLHGTHGGHVEKVGMPQSRTAPCRAREVLLEDAVSTPSPTPFPAVLVGAGEPDGDAEPDPAAARGGAGGGAAGQAEPAHPRQAAAAQSLQRAVAAAQPGLQPGMLEPAGEQGNVLDPLPDRVPLQTTQQEMEKLKAQYRSLARDSAQAKRKYQEASKGANLAPVPCMTSQLPLRVRDGWSTLHSVKTTAQPGAGGGSGVGQHRGEPSLAPRKPGRSLGALGHHAVGQGHLCVTL